MSIAGHKPDVDTGIASIGLIKMAVALLCADPENLCGIVISAQHSPIREALKNTLVKRFNTIQLPSNAGFVELYGGLDSAATLANGQLVKQKGLLERSSESGLLLSSVQRLPAYITSTLCSAIDVRRQTGSATSAHSPRVVIAIDDSLEQEPGIHASALAERLALHVSIPDLSVLDTFNQTGSIFDDGQELFQSQAESTLKINPADVILTDKTLKELTCLALQLGASSMLPLLNTCRVARTIAALEGRELVSDDDAVVAVQLALAPHAMLSPEHQNSDEQEEHDASESPSNAEEPPTDTAPPEAAPEHLDESDGRNERTPDDALEERLVEAAQAALPQHLLASLAQTHARGADSGRDKQATTLSARGRPIGILRPKGSLSGQRINVLESLKVAVPMQGFRRVNHSVTQQNQANRIKIRLDDLRVTRYRQSSRTTTVFVVDASGSSAMHRLAEAKGAVELLLAECYIRRDRVALITFRGTEATLDLPPTRSLTRAKRALQNLPGGGGTPLASGLQLAYRVLCSLSQEGEAPIGVIMTDAKANIALDGTASRDLAALDALHQSQLLKTTSARLLFIDTANRKGVEAQKLASHMGASYLALPRSGSTKIPELVSGLSR